MADERTTKKEMLPILGKLRRAVLDEENDLNATEFRAALAKFINEIEAYVYNKEQW